jgi:hypothetical protein
MNWSGVNMWNISVAMVGKYTRECCSEPLLYVAAQHGMNVTVFAGQIKGFSLILACLDTAV